MADRYIALNEQCYDKRYDLVSQRNHYNIDGSIEPICAVGLSRQLLTNIGEYANTRHFLPFIEYMFNTIAMHNELNVYCPRELSTINNWIFKEIQERPMNWFHPIKNFQQQRRFREK